MRRSFSNLTLVSSQQSFEFCEVGGCSPLTRFSGSLYLARLPMQCQTDSGFLNIEK